jgi:hypothetical protein
MHIKRENLVYHLNYDAGGWGTSELPGGLLPQQPKVGVVMRCLDG